VLPFQAVLHTYLALPDNITPRETTVLGLKGLEFTDKAAGYAKVNQFSKRDDFVHLMI
jgi:hypothetical protein